jgi:hypothetical protein
MSSTRPSRAGSSATSSGRACSKYDSGFDVEDGIRQLAGYAWPVRAPLDARNLPAIAGCIVAELVVVAVVALEEPTSGALAVVAALVLAPVAVASAAAAAGRLARGRFPVAAAVVYVLLPLAANRFVLASSRPAFDRSALPTLVGTQHTWLLAVGILAAVLAATLPERAAAAVGAGMLVASIVVWGTGALGGVQTLLHETGWSVAFPEWLLVATIVAAVLRRPYLGAALGCFAVCVVLRAAHHTNGVGAFWSALAPLVPVGAVLVSSLWLLVPRLRLAAARRPVS